MKGIISSLATGGIVVTYRCNAQCAHCVRCSSLERDDQFMDLDMLRKIIQKLKEFNCKSVHIEGGEPFLYPRQLADVVSILHQNGIGIEHIATNASWYRNSRDTNLLLKKLQENGLRTLLVKVSAFQNEFIPLNKVFRLNEAADKLGIKVLIWDSESYPEVASFDASKTHTLKEYQKKFGDDYIQKLASRFTLALSGRAYNLYSKYMNKMPLNEILANGASCHQEFATKHHFHIDLYGNFIFPFTKGLTVKIEDLSKMLDQDKYPFLSVILTEGLQGLLQIAVRKYHFIPQQEYISKCHLCYDIRAYLVKNQNINSPDLQPVELYFSE
jgi:organic radical activating enzyme